MKPTFRKSMIWLHTYVGVICGWLLFAIFFTGTLSYFTPEITRWLTPERNAIQLTEKEMISTSFDYLADNAPAADEWRVYLPTPRNSHWYVQWREGKGREKVTFDNNKDVVETETDTQGGLFFRNFHYTLQLRQYGGRYITGIAAMAMLIGVFTGIYTHRRFFKDFFTLRPQDLKTLLSDFHALAGILTLPFCIMICISGIFIYAIMYLPFAANTHFDRGERGVNSEIIPSLPTIEGVGTLTPDHIIALPAVLNYLDNQWTEPHAIARITVEQPQFKNSRMIVERTKSTTVSNRAQRLVFETYTGKLATGYADESIPAQIRRILYGLHQANYAPAMMRWLLFGLGVLGSALIASGQIMWVRQRKLRAKEPQTSHTFVERGNVAVIMGLVLSSLSFFIASKLLPGSLADRADWEIRTFLLVWLVCAIHGFLRSHPRRVWIEQSMLASVLCLVIVAVEFALHQGRILNAIAHADVRYLSFIPAFVFGAWFFFTFSGWLKKPRIAHDSAKTRTT